MRKIMLLAVLVSGCATMHERVYSSIRVGDPASKVQDLLGTPDSFQPSQKIPGAVAWYYTSRKNVCGFAIKDESVALLGCDVNPNYINPAAAFFKGFSEGMAHQTQTAQPASVEIRQPTICNSTLIGNQVSTSCN